MQMSTGLPDQILLVFCTVEASDFHEERGPVQCCLQRYILASYARCRVELRVLFTHIRTKVQPSALLNILGVDALKTHAHTYTLNEHVTESIRKKQKTEIRIYGQKNAQFHTATGIAS